MRTKTILLSGVVAALSSASLMAQVFSLNSVGYVNLTVPNGFSIIANQLNTTNNNLSPLLDSQITNATPPGALDFINFFKFNGHTYSTYTTDSSLAPASPWDGAATNTSLNPGEAVFIQNTTGSAITLTFVGTVLQGAVSNTNIIGGTSSAGGFSLVSSMIPQGGRIDTDLGMPEVDFDNVFLYNVSTGHYDTYTGDSFNLPQAPWDSPTGTNPVVAVGQGFFYESFNPAGNPWVRNFSVN